MSETDATEFFRRVGTDRALADAVVAAMKTAMSTASGEQGLDVSADDVDAVLAGAQKGAISFEIPEHARNCWTWQRWTDEF